MPLPTPALQHFCDVEVALGALEDHGMTRAGHRRIIPIVGGRISGGIRAEILPGGADWQVVRPDGTVEIDGRYSARTAGGDLLYIRVAGVRSGDPAVLGALLRGEQVDAARYYFRTVVTFETAAAHWAHLEQSIYVSVAERTKDAVRYALYRLT